MNWCASCAHSIPAWPVPFTKGGKIMIVSKLKPWSEIEKYISGDDTIFVLGCNGCAKSSGTGGMVEVAKMQEQIKSAGKSVSGTLVIDFLCQEMLVASRMRPRTKQLEASDAILVMTCGIGVQTVAAVAGIVCHPACDTVYMGGARGECPAGERCQECGECAHSLAISLRSGK